jgi:hypothetical protein
VEFRRRLSIALACLAALATTATEMASAAPPSLRSTSSAVRASSYALAISRPAGVVAGDVLVADLVIRLRARAAILAPSGWRLVRRDRSAPSHGPLSQALYYKVAGSSEPSAYTWKWPSRYQAGATGGIFAYSGVDAEAPIEAHSGGYRSKSTRIVAPSTVLRHGDVALLGFFGENGSTAITGPASMTPRFDSKTTYRAGKVRLRGATGTVTGAGATGDVVASISGNGSGGTIGQLVALRPAQRPSQKPSQKAPVNNVVPSITGTPQVGQKLVAQVGSWTSQDAPTYAFQWLRCNGSGSSCADLSGATGQTYSLSPADAGSEMRVRVTATSSGGSTSATSAATTAVTQPDAPVNVSQPTISGTFQQGQTLNANPGTWSTISLPSYTYAWQRCDSAGASCANISGAVGPQYRLTSSDVGSRIRVAVTAADLGGSSVALSAISPVIAATPSSFTPSLAHPFPPGSFWVSPLPDNPAVDPLSSDRISYWLSNAGPIDLTLRRYAVADAVASPTDPTYSVTTCIYTCTLNRWGAFRIPAGTRADPGSDGHLAILDPSTGREWGMWQAQYNSTTNTWTAGSGAALDLNTEIAAPAAVSGANDANFPALAGIVRPEELASGHIDHPLVYETPPRGKGAARCPATANHGTDTSSLALPQGALLQLDPSLDVNSLAIPAWEKTVARALQVYGMYMRDGANGSTDLIGENTINRGDQWTTLMGWTGNYAYFSSAFPWNRMRVLAPTC